MGILCMFDQINIVFGQFFQFLTIILADPENKTLIGKSIPYTGHMVVNAGRNEDHIPRFQMMIFFFNGDRYISLQKKIEFIVIVGVICHAVKMVVIIVVNFKIVGQHILSFIKRRL